MKTETCAPLRSLRCPPKGIVFKSFRINNLPKHYKYDLPYTNITTEATQLKSVPSQNTNQGTQIDPNMLEPGHRRVRLHTRHRARTQAPHRRRCR